MDYFDILLANRINGGAGGGVSDVQINGTSIVEGGVANIPVASENDLGVVKTYANLGTSMSLNTVTIEGATSQAIKNPSLYASWRRPILPQQQHEAAFYGLAKAAGDSTQSASLNPVGTYTDTAKEKIQKMIGIETPTQAEYDALTTKSPSTLYFIKED